MRVIVQYREEATAERHARTLRRGGRLRHDLPLVRGGAYTVTAAQVEELAADPEVEQVSLDHEVRATLDYAEQATAASIALSNGFSGQGVGIAVLDSGIADHPDLHNPATGATRVVYSESLLGDKVKDDLYGHGTHVAGILAGNGASSTGPAYSATIQGIAPQATLISLRVLDGNGVGSDSAVIAGIHRAIALKNTYNIRVLNLSLGRAVTRSYKVDPLCQAVEAAWQAGIVVVVAAGNEGRDYSRGTYGYATITAPGNDPYVITVGAMKTNETPSRSDDTIASYSSKGPSLFDFVVKPDLVAPGNNIVSLQVPSGKLPKNNPGNDAKLSDYVKGAKSGVSDKYFTLSGTSYGNPHGCRGSRSPDPAESDAYPGPGEGQAHEDRQQSLPDVHQRDDPGAEPDVHDDV